jgi:tartrate-resistant acid phosphatase type 5
MAAMRFLAPLFPACAAEMHFLAMGDWGGSEKSPYTTSSEVATAKGMDSVAGSLGAKFALALGDNFYSHGLQSVDDERFDKTFEQCFSGGNLQASSGFRFNVVAGNHDHRGNVQAQIDYSERNERWHFPSEYYSFSETAPDGATVEIVLIDTVQLSGISDHENFVKGSELPGPLNATAAGAQLEWLQETLSKSTADFLIVGGHYPVHSVAEHGPTKQLQPSVFPYLQDNRVSAYVCGHDHNQQHIDVGDGVQYHVIGSAHGGDSSTAHMSTISKDQLKFHEPTHGGFSTFSVSKQGLVIKHLDASGKVLYTAPTIPPRGSAPVPSPSPVPTPSPAPTPSPSPMGWDCRSNMKSGLGSDSDLQGTGDDISTCHSACESTENCVAVNWHKTDNHCHIKVGGFARDDFEASLTSSSNWDSCFKASALLV